MEYLCIKILLPCSYLFFFGRESSFYFNILASAVNVRKHITTLDVPSINWVSVDSSCLNMLKNNNTELYKQTNIVNKQKLVYIGRQWPRGNVQVCIFAREEVVFPLRRPLSVALLLRQVFNLGKFF